MCLKIGDPPFLLVSLKNHPKRGPLARQHRDVNIGILGTNGGCPFGLNESKPATLKKHTHPTKGNQQESEKGFAWGLLGCGPNGSDNCCSKLGKWLRGPTRAKGQNRGPHMVLAPPRRETNCIYVPIFPLETSLNKHHEGKNNQVCQWHKGKPR